MCVAKLIHRSGFDDLGARTAYACGRLSMLGRLSWIEKYNFFHPSL
jgi:hypothetical protein